MEGADEQRPAGGPMTTALGEASRRGLRVAMLVLLAGWILDLPARLGIALYSEQFLALLVGLVTALVLLDPRRGRAGPNLAFAGAALGVFTVVALSYPTLQASMASPTPLQGLLAAGMLVVLLEATRRRLGLFLPILVLALAALIAAGPWLPAGLETRPVAPLRLLIYLGLDSNAMFGRILVTAAIVIVPFIVFGVLFGALGGSARMTAVVAALVGGRRGGAAKVSIAGSAAFGMLSGSAVANVMAVGSMSIPMMIRAGYPRHLAAAIEALGSTGGQLMPPIMGASAFLMAEFLELPYRAVVLAALLPALVFYAALWLAADFEARGAARRALHDTLVPNDGNGARLLLPVVLLLWLLFVAGWTPGLAGGCAVLATVVVYLPGALAGLRERAGRVATALAEAMDPVADIVLIGATAGLIIGLLSLSGLSFALTLQTLALGRESLALLLLATAALSLLLGLGMPTVGVYALLATLLAPALTELGVQPLAAHLYVLYFGMFSMITPPIALASFAAASVARADPWRASLAALRMGAAVYLVPVAFVLQPELLLAGSGQDTLIAALRLLLAVTLMSASALGHAARPLPAWQRVLAAGIAVVNVLPRDQGLPEWLPWAALVAGVAWLPGLLRTRAACR